MTLPEKRLLHEFIDYWANVDPNFPSIQYGTKSIITAKELKDKSMIAAAGFLQMGLQKGDSIITILTTIPEFIITLIAASRIGVITIPMDVNYKRSDFLAVIPHSNPKLIITLKRHHKNKIASTLAEIKDKFPNVQYIIKGKHNLGQNWRDFMSQEYEDLSQVLKAQENRGDEENFLVVWTGGSTGKPKAALLSQKNMIVMAASDANRISEWMGYESGKDRFKWIANLPVSHVGGIIEMIGTGLVAGLQTILQKEWSPWSSLQVIPDEGIRFIGGVPTMYSIWTSLRDIDTYNLKEHLEIAFISGAPVSLALLNTVADKMCDNILIGYGSTEAGAEVTFTKPGDSFEDLANGYVGLPMEGVDIKIMDKEGNILPSPQDGEICVKGDVSITKYFNMPEEDKQGFTKDGYCRTGDLGHLDENGGLWVTGRIKFIIRTGSYTVLPSEIENIVNTVDDVLCCAAYGVPDETYEQVIWLVIVPEPGSKIDVGIVKKLLEKEIAKYKIPRKILIYDADPTSLPFTSIGKVDRPRIQRELHIPKP